MNRHLFSACAVSMICASFTAQGAVVGTLEFDSSWNVIATSAVNASITSGSYAGVTATPTTSGSNTVIDSSGWSNGYPANQYLDFTISASPGYTVTVDSVDLRAAVSASPFSSQGTYSFDGSSFSTYGSVLDMSSSSLDAFSTFTQTLTSAAGGPIVFRLLISAPSTSAVLSVGNVPGSNTFVAVNGTVQPVPEPASSALAAFAAGGVWLIRRLAVGKRRVRA
jgi:hypothetical protein